jgi:hypothetical protein
MSAPRRPWEEEWEEEFMEGVESLDGISRAPEPGEELELGLEPEPKPERARQRGRRT